MEAVQPVVDIVVWIYTNYAAVLGAVVAVLMALMALFQLIPGEQPEKTLKAFVDLITKFSRK